MHIHVEYTHPYERRLQVVAFLGWLFLLEAVVQRSWYYLIPGVPLCGGLTWFLCCSPLKHFLYARLSLGAAVSWEDADVLRPLFEASPFDKKWFPMTEVKRLPREARRDALLYAVYTLNEGRWERMLASLPEDLRKPSTDISESTNVSPTSDPEEHRDKSTLPPA